MSEFRAGLAQALFSLTIWVGGDDFLNWLDGVYERIMSRSDRRE